jgi:hypothetical protein
MRKYLALSVLGVCLLVLAPATAAFAGGSTYYAGKNSQGQKLFFSVDHTSSGPKFDPFFTSMSGQCSATGTKFTILFSFSGFQVPIKNGNFSLSLNDISDRFNWSGNVTSTGATGTQVYSLAGFDNEGGLQICSTGVLPWKAKALGSPVKPAAPSIAYKIKVTKAANGAVSFNITR